MELSGTAKVKDFREITTSYFDNILHFALRLTKNQIKTETLTIEACLQARKAFCFCKPEINRRVWPLRILFRQFNHNYQRSSGSKFIEGGNKVLKPTDSLEIKSSKKVFV